MRHREKIIGIIMLLFAIGFNLWLYRLEPTAKIDPNDNLFQFALVYRTNQIWDFAQQTCSGFFISRITCHVSLLVDHWVPNWNEGYNLPFYYSHLPQIVIVGSWRLVSSTISLFAYYHLVIYLLLCLFPLSVFLALLITNNSFLTAGFAALLASHISTDGLYGLDPPSFLWRGYGLSSQLFAMIWLPLAIAYAWRYFSLRSNKVTKLLTNDLYLVILFLVLTTSGHIGIGIMAFLSLIPLAFAEPLMTLIQQQWNRDAWERVKTNTVKLTVLSGAAIFLLSYWLVPALLSDKFHNFSFWDPVWKFNSYGAKEVLTRLGNGDLFDFGRLPIFTALVFVGFFVLLSRQASTPLSFPLLFIFWLLLYFGRTTWGSLINLIPTMKEFHLSRFIVGVHLAGLFLAPIGLTWLISRITYHVSRFSRHWSIGVFVYLIIGLLLLIPIYQQTVRYNDLNNTLIKRANDNYAKQSPDVDSLIINLKSLISTHPGRVFAGRGGGWGKDFKLAETNMTMYLGNFALPTVLWLPETWSPNGDTEQYFREDKEEDYALYNIRYVATPANLAKENIQPFWKLIKDNPSWKLYEVTDGPSSVIPSNAEGSPEKTSQILRKTQDNQNMNFGYFTSGVRPAIVAADKYSRTNVVRLWIQSDDPKNGLYPELTFDANKYPVNVGLPNFKMLDEVTFETPDLKIYNVFTAPPRYLNPLSDLNTLSHVKITDQKDDADMVFSARVSVPSGCTECLVILKQSYHPNWQVTVDGNKVNPIITFPFYIGIPVSAGTHTIVASYEPSGLKVMLLVITGITLIGGIAYAAYLWRMEAASV